MSRSSFLHAAYSVHKCLMFLSISEPNQLTLQALARGVHFEILYAPMIRDSSARRMTISNANLLVEMCRGKVSGMVRTLN